MAVKKTPRTAARTAARTSAKTGTGAGMKTSPAAKTAVKTAAKTVAKTAAKTTAKTAAKTAAKTGTVAASKGHGQMVNQTKAQVDQGVAVAKVNVEKASEAASKGYDELAVLGQGNFDAFIQSNSVVAKGFEVIGKEFLAFAQRSVEGHMAQARALIGAKDMQEFVDLQNDFAKRRLADTLAETAKLTELSTQVANEAIEPLQKRVDATVETALKAKAA
jgi:phasin family protein